MTIFWIILTVVMHIFCAILGYELFGSSKETKFGKAMSIIIPLALGWFGLLLLLLRELTGFKIFNP